MFLNMQFSVICYYETTFKRGIDGFVTQERRRAEILLRPTEGQNGRS